jgi:hypothetical protein
VYVPVVAYAPLENDVVRYRARSSGYVYHDVLGVDKVDVDTLLLCGVYDSFLFPTN